MTAPTLLRIPGPLRASFALLAAAAMLSLVSACGNGGGGGDGGGGSASAAPSTGSVAVLLTDGPVPPSTFKHIFVTYIEIILIGEPGQVTIFEGRETVDLRDLEDVSKLATLGRDVPAGLYEKIRLVIEEIELVRADTNESIILSRPPNKLPPKIDLNPRGKFRVFGGKLLYLQIDMDAGKAIHVVETGREDKYQFRPVVFVDILRGPVLGKLVLLRGVVEDVDDEEGTFELCRSHPVSRPKDGERSTRYPDDDEGDDDDDGDDEIEDHCVEVVAIFEGNKTSFFDESGDPTDFEDIDDGDEASVLGRFRIDDGDDDGYDDEELVFEAEVVQLGDPLAVDGVAETVVENDEFLVLLDEGQDNVFDGDTLLVLLQQGTKVFTRKGLPLLASKIQVEDPVRATGIPALSNTSEDALKAAFIMVDIAAMEEDRLAGVIDEEPEDGGARLEVRTADGVVCVDVPATARVFEILSDDGLGSAIRIDRSELQEGDRINVFGEEGASPGDCFTAETVISFGDDVEAVPLPSDAPVSSAGAGVSSAFVADEEALPEVEEEALLAPGAVEVYEVEPARVEAGLIWVKLPGDEDGSGAASE